jgi:hypothetical protein
MTRPSLLRVLIAIGCLAIGVIHLRLYFDSYRDIPDSNIGASFVVNAIAAGAAAVIVLVWASRLALLAPLLLANATLVGFAMSRTDRGILNFTEKGWNPTPDAALAVAFEIVTAVLAVVALYLERPLSTSSPDRSARAAAGTTG